MSISGYRGRTLGAALVKEGVIPANAMDVDLHIPVDGLLVLRYVVRVEPADIPKIMRALATLQQPEEVKTP